MDTSKIKNLRQLRQRKSLSCSKSLPVKPAGNLKCRINAVVENNRILASCLEETRCELSEKQKILDEYSGHITNMKFARFKMLEMSSALKCFLRNFDEILPLLHVEEPTYFVSRFRSRKKNMSSLEKIIESPNEFIETDPMPTDEEIVEINDKNVLASPSASEKLLTKATAPEVGDSSVKNLHLVTNNSLPCFNDVENISLSKDSNVAEAEFQELPISLPNGSEDIKQTAADNFVPTTDEVTSTPRLSSPIKRLINAQAALMFGSNDVFNRSPLSTTSNVIKPVAKLSDNIQLPLNSKIPKLQGFCKSKRKTEEKIASKSSKILKVAEKSDSIVSRRKTFVKAVNPSTAYELPIISNEIPDSEDLSNENSSKIEPESGKTNKSRKTFVVKAADILEDFEISPCDRRKTFVKKTCKARKMSLMGENKVDFKDLPLATDVSQLNEQAIPNNEPLLAVVPPDNPKQALCDDVSATGTKTSCMSSSEVNKFIESTSDERVNSRENKMPSSFNKDSVEEMQQNETNFIIGTKLTEIEDIDKDDRAESKEINPTTKDLKNIEIMEIGVLNIISDKQVSTAVTNLSKTENVGKNKEIAHETKFSGTTKSDTFNIISDKQDFLMSNKIENVKKNAEVESKVITRGSKNLKNKGTTESDTLNINSEMQVFTTSSETENIEENNGVQSKAITHGTKNLKNKKTKESDTLNINSDKQGVSTINKTENDNKNNGVKSKVISHDTKNLKNKGTTESDTLNINPDKPVGLTSSETENVDKINDGESKAITRKTKNLKNKGITEGDTLNINSDKLVFSTLSKTENMDKNNRVANTEISFGTKYKTNDESTEIYVLNITSNNLLSDNEIEELNKSEDDIFVEDHDKNIFDALESSDSYIEIPDFNFDSPEPVFKTVPIRRRISKSKPKKVFKFDGYKKKSTSHKTSIGVKSKIIKQRSNICQPDVDHQNNIELENQNNLHSNIAGNKSNVADSCKSSNDECQDAIKKHELPESLDKNSEFKSRNQNECANLKDSIASTSSRSYITNEINFPTESVKHPCSHLIVMDEQIQIDCQNKESEMKNPISRKFKSPKRIANGDDLKSLRKKSKTNSGKSKVIDLCEDGDTLSGNEMDNLKQENHLGAKVKKKSKNAKSKVKSRKKTPNSNPEENTYLTQAEIHSPPPCFRTLQNDTLDKENEVMPCKRLQIVLNDVLKVNSKKEDVSDRGKRKNPLSSSPFNIHPPEVSDKDAADDQSESEDSKVATRRTRRKPVCYKELSLNSKLRRK